MAYYGVIFPEFWTGRTGHELRACGKDAQLLGLYLATNRHANMLGLYRLLIADIRHETGLGLKGLERAFEATARTQYATFDAASSYVWVRSMVRIRVGLKPGEHLSLNDLKVKAINRIYHALDPNPFLGEFYDANRRMLNLSKRRESTGVVVPVGADPQMSGLEGATKALGSQVTGSGIRKQDQVKSAARRAANAPTENAPTENKRVIRAMVTHLVQDETARGLGFADLKDLAKEACAEKGLAYDADVVGSALEQALARRRAS